MLPAIFCTKTLLNKPLSTNIWLICGLFYYSLNILFNYMLPLRAKYYASINFTKLDRCPLTNELIMKTQEIKELLYCFVLLAITATKGNSCKVVFVRVNLSGS